MKNFSAEGLVLKRSDSGELDRVVTLLTKQNGKLVAVAKGARKLTSSRLAALEPGTLIQASFAETKGLPILTQTRVIQDFSGLKSDLSSLRSVFQILEMLDVLLPEGETETEVFEIAVALLNSLSEGVNRTQAVRVSFSRILTILGFAESTDLNQPLAGLIENLTQRKLKAFAYLTT